MFNPALLVPAIIFAMSSNNKQPKPAPKETIDPRIEHQEIYNSLNSKQPLSWLIEQSKNINHVIYIDGYVWTTNDLLCVTEYHEQYNVIIEHVEPRLNGVDGMVIYCNTYVDPK